MLQDLNRVIEHVSKEKSIPKEQVIQALEAAMLMAARKKYGHEREIEARYNEEIGEVELFQFRTVADPVETELTQVSLEEAKKLDPDAQMGDSIGEKLDNRFLGRIAAQTAKQVIVQKVRDAERDIIFNEYKDRVGEIITGMVRRVEKNTLIVDVGRAEAIVPPREQVRTEIFKPGDRIQAYFLSIEKTHYGPQLILSRRDRRFMVKLFEMEVPEITAKIVEIKNAAREAGARSKIAVYSRDSDVDPVGACVGMKGSRVQSVVQELRGEKIDIVAWDNDPARFVCNAIAPAEVSRVIINEKDHSMEIVVPDDQLSLAIGKKGQNVRLAAELTGWSIDIYSESKLEEMAKKAKKNLVDTLQVEESTATILYSQAYRSPEEIAEASLEELRKVPGLAGQIEGIHKAAQKYVRENREGSDLRGEEKSLNSVKGIGAKTMELLKAAGFTHPSQIVQCTPEVLSEKTGIPQAKAVQLIENSRACLEGADNSSEIKENQAEATS
ncbi:MAG: transcription termination/antitermination protein NusA [Deltaproteobacteria bacterium]|nr:transcription termination/antitermination protein NusA [Deltaproteobacteria bacterium]MBI2500923.1 transcription termination/antitermination protein NusA [Deltaproteobacteria bacterium]MBI4197371.1 transcription termination/antitermination protein NusA [Deltaproteobacteria bacterium]